MPRFRNSPANHRSCFKTPSKFHFILTLAVLRWGCCGSLNHDFFRTISCDDVDLSIMLPSSWCFEEKRTLPESEDRVRCLVCGGERRWQHRWLLLVLLCIEQLLLGRRAKLSLSHSGLLFMRIWRGCSNATGSLGWAADGYSIMKMLAVHLYYIFFISDWLVYRKVN